MNEWMNGCMSVIDRSCFSYQVAAGRTLVEFDQQRVIERTLDAYASLETRRRRTRT